MYNLSLGLATGTEDKYADRTNNQVVEYFTSMPKTSSKYCDMSVTIGSASQALCGLSKYPLKHSHLNSPQVSLSKVVVGTGGRANTQCYKALLAHAGEHDLFQPAPGGQGQVRLQY